MGKELKMAIDASFELACKEMDSVHRSLSERIKGLDVDGTDVEMQLAEEIERYEVWRKEIMGYLADVVQRFASDEHQQHKAWVKQTDYWHMIQEAPFCRRIIHKPEGYAGDALLMEQIYRNTFEGKTPLGKFFHKNAVSSLACQAVRNRAVFLKEYILKTKGGRILSVAAGLIKEVRHFLSEYDAPNSYQFMALDHDLNTLKGAKSLIGDDRVRYGLANVFDMIKGNMTVVVAAEPDLNSEKSSDNLMWNKHYAARPFQREQLELASFDLVYSAGLYDYIKTFPRNPRRGAVALTKQLFDLVKPGGKLIIGNFSDNNPKDIRFGMEYLYDWNLIYRNRKQIIQFADTIAADQIDDMVVKQEPLGINYFLIIAKKANPVF